MGNFEIDTVRDADEILQKLDDIENSIQTAEENGNLEEKRKLVAYENALLWSLGVVGEDTSDEWEEGTTIRERAEKLSSN